MKFNIFLTGVFTLLVLFCTGCGLDPDTEPLSLIYSSRLTQGCIRQIPFDQMTNEALLTWMYEENDLELYINFDTHCLASMKDSIRFNNNNISIFLADTVSQTSTCACIYREVYYFSVSGYEEVNLYCYFKPYASNEYKTVLNQSLQLTTTL